MAPAPSVPTSGLRRALSEIPILKGGPCDGEIDAVQWRNSVVDLHKVMEVCKNLYLILEHSNEALVRVALLICCDRTARKVLWWKDFWWSEEEKREYLKELVRQKLAIAIAQAKGCDIDLEELANSRSGPDPYEEIQALKKRLEEAEASSEHAKRQQTIAEAKVKEAEASTAEARNRIADLERALKELREQVKSQSMNTGVDTAKPTDNGRADLEELLRQLQQKLKLSEEQCRKLEGRLSDAEQRLKSAESASATKSSSEDEKRRQSYHKPEPKAPPPQTVIVESKGNNKELEAEKARSRQLEEQLQAALAEVERLKKLLAELQSNNAELELFRRNSLAAAAAAGTKSYEPHSSTTEVKTVFQMSPEQAAELASLKAKLADYDRLLAKIAKRDAIIADLRRQLAELEEKQARLLQMLQRLKDQLKQVTALAESRGLGDMLKSLFKDSGLDESLNDPEWTIFDRLYEDALRRQMKMRKLQERLTGQVMPLEDPEAEDLILGYKYSQIRKAAVKHQAIEELKQSMKKRNKSPERPEGEPPPTPVASVNIDSAGLMIGGSMPRLQNAAHTRASFISDASLAGRQRTPSPISSRLSSAFILESGDHPGRIEIHADFDFENMPRSAASRRTLQLQPFQDLSALMRPASGDAGIKRPGTGLTLDGGSGARSAVTLGHRPSSSQLMLVAAKPGSSPEAPVRPPPPARPAAHKVEEGSGLPREQVSSRPNSRLNTSASERELPRYADTLGAARLGPADQGLRRPEASLFLQGSPITRMRGSMLVERVPLRTGSPEELGPRVLWQHRKSKGLDVGMLTES